MGKYESIYVIGLTGGIATGKSSVSSMLKRLGAIIVDADAISREVTSRGSPGLAEIVKAFGPGILSTSGELDRRKLGDIVFRDEKALSKLNSIVHPRVTQRVQELFQREEALAKAEGKPRIVVLDAPLLVEAGVHQLVDEIWVVDLDEETQIKRLIAREGYSYDEALARIGAQMSLEEKKKYADEVIDNRSSMEATMAQVVKLWEKVNRKLGAVG